ncbi:hypothetical protein VTN77DRAFT_2852 [Rasamsonia byssochlamydoides]|uniref:uncharacterized protein n=1 Tax=Rasamsonia byssochlamydoides TaxID=89139 RepID=UPI0037436A99
MVFSQGQPLAGTGITGLLPRSLSDILPAFPFSNSNHSCIYSCTRLLPLLGLITSTGALTFAYAEATYLSPLLAGDDSDNENDKNVSPSAIRTVWAKSFPFGLGAILTLGVGSLVGGIAGYRLSLSRSTKPESTTAGLLYAAGTAFSLVHFVFVPWIASAIRPMIEPDSPEESQVNGKNANNNNNNTKRDNLRKWLRIHAVRTLVADIPAFLFFLGATAAYFHGDS